MIEIKVRKDYKELTEFIKEKSFFLIEEKQIEKIFINKIKHNANFYAPITNYTDYSNEKMIELFIIFKNIPTFINLFVDKEIKTLTDYVEIDISKENVESKEKIIYELEREKHILEEEIKKINKENNEKKESNSISDRLIDIIEIYARKEK